MKILNNVYSVLCRLSAPIQKYKYIIFCTVALLGILPVIYISRYNFPAVDDYAYSMWVREVLMQGGSFFDAIVEAFNTDMYFMNRWQGLYISGFLLALQPAVFGLEYAWIGPVMLMLLMASSIYFFCDRVFFVLKIKDRAMKTWLAVLVTFYVIQCMQSPTEGIFWFNGAVNYTFFWCFVLINIALLLHCFYKENIGILMIMLPSVVSFIITGGNHVSAFLNIMICLFFAIFGFVKKQKKPTIAAVAALIVAVVCFIIVMTAPGTAIRQAELNKQSVIYTMAYSVWRLCIITGEYITVSFICFVLLITPVLWTVAKKLPKIEIIHVFVAVVMFLICECGIICVPYYAMGKIGDPRVQNIIFFTWIIGFVVIYTIVLAFLGRLTEWQLMPKAVALFCNNIAPIAGVVLIAYIFVMGNHTQLGTGAKAAKELFIGTPQQLIEEYKEREELAAQGETVFKPLTAKDTMVFMADLNASAEHWENYAFARYYGTESAAVDYK